MARKRKRKSINKKGGISLQVATLCVSTSLVLVLLGMTLCIALTARNLSDYFKENLTVTVVYEDNVTSQQAKVHCSTLKKERYVSHYDFISKERALKEQTAVLGANPQEFLGENPFAASAEVYLKADYANNDSIKWIVKGLKANKLVSEVTYQQDLMNKVNENLRKIMLVMISLAVLLLFVSYTLISNSVRLAIYARRFTINTMKLVGASWSFIRKPFIRMGMLEGLIAGAVADAVIGACLYGLYNYEPDIALVVTPFVVAVTGISVLFFGVIISTMCVFLSVNRYLRMNANDMYKL